MSHQLAGVRTYIAGPMSGIEKLNFPLFGEVEQRLRAFGAVPVNPAHNGDEQQQGGYYPALRAAYRQVIDCEAVVLLPGWERSNGARTEKAIADSLGMALYEYRPELVSPFLDYTDPPETGIRENCRPMTDEEVRAQRQVIYGDPLENHRGIAMAIAGLLQPHWERIRDGKPVPVWVVALVMVALKLNRMRNVFHADNYQDAGIYMGFAEDWQRRGLE